MAYLHAQDAPPVDITEDDSASEEDMDAESDASSEDDSSDIEISTEGRTAEEIEAIKKSLGMSGEIESPKKKTETKRDETVMTLEEVQEFIYSLPAAKDAIDIPVSEEASWQKIYDIYSRQIAYRESAKKLRASLEARQESFAEPRTKIINAYKENLKKVYAAERAAYQESLASDKKNSKKTASTMKKSGDDEEKIKSSTASETDEDGKKEKVASAPKPKKQAPEEDIGLKEQEIPTTAEEGKKKKVITAENAPDFDPSNL